MNTVTKKSTTHIEDSWEKISDTDAYSFNDVVNAWVKGKEEGLNITQKTILNALKENILKTVQARAKVYKFLKEKGFKALIAHLKVESPYSFQILFVVPEGELLNNDFLKVYDFISELENEVNEELYNVHLSFVDSSDTLDENQFEADGFIAKYTLKK